MSDDRDLQEWFKRSVEALPAQPFTQEVVERVQRSERHWQLLRYAAWFAALSSVCLLLVELIPVLYTLPFAVIAIGGEQWPALVVSTMGFGWWLSRQSHDPGFTRRLISQILQR
jgi:hypothetical protein